MTSLRKYLTHRLRSTMVLTLVLCIFAVILVMTSVSVSVWTSLDWFDQNGNRLAEPIRSQDVSINNFGIVAYIIGAMCTFAPIVELGDMKNKRNADLIYSLPVSRSKMAIAHYVSGAIQIFAVYTVSYITMVLKVLTSENVRFIQQREMLFVCYFVLLGVGIGLYSIFMAVFNSANTVIDGCLFIGAWSILPALFLIALGDFDGETGGAFGLSILERIFVSEDLLMPHSALVVCDNFYSILVGDKTFTRYAEAAVAWSIVGIICAAVYFYSFTKKRTEEIGDISSTAFGYKVLLPIGVFSMTQAFDEELTCLILAALIGVVGYMIYRRSFKIRKPDIITLAAVLLFTEVSMAVL